MALNTLDPHNAGSSEPAEQHSGLNSRDYAGPLLN
jgi:hypothetical protein